MSATIILTSVHGTTEKFEIVTLNIELNICFTNRCLWIIPYCVKYPKILPWTIPDLEKFIQDMFITMDEADGVGLAAPQVGRNIRIFTVDGNAFEEIDPDCKGFRKVFINARILERWGNDVTRNEGCLSVPGIHEDVKRKDNIRIAYMNEKGEQLEEEYAGVKGLDHSARYDHLEGILFTDHLSALKKRILKSKLTNIALGKFKAPYRVILPK